MIEPQMDRRYFLTEGLAAGAGALSFSAVAAAERGRTGPADFSHPRSFVTTTFGRIAYTEMGSGPAAIFLHGWPLSGYHWRGAIARLQKSRRCVAPDFMGLGHTEVPPDADLAPARQAEMIVALMDSLGVARADLISNDSGTTVAQLLAAHHPERVRSMLLTNGDVHTNSPPPALLPVIEQARQGILIDWFERHLREPSFAASEEGLGQVYTDPAFFTPALTKAYLGPLMTSAVKRRQCQQYGVAFEPNPLPAIEPLLRKSAIPARMLWGTGDALFPPAWANWLHEALPHSTGIRLIAGAKLFFTEEFPDVVADEAHRLWTVETGH